MLIQIIGRGQTGKSTLANNLKPLLEGMGYKVKVFDERPLPTGEKKRLKTSDDAAIIVKTA